MVSERLRLAVGVCLAAFVTLAAQAVVGTVTRVIDGDTIVVEGVGTVRLIGVDTPETVDPRLPVQYFGAEATAFTTRLAQGQQVRLEFEGASKDRFDRTLAYVYLPDGTLLNAEIVRQGYGHAYMEFPFAKMEEFRRLQREAAEAGRGLWAGEAAVLANLEREPQAETVYVTKTGTKYHKAGCRHLARSQIPMPLKEAAAQYGPCSVCRPPTLGATRATRAVTPPALTTALSTGPSPDAATPVVVTRTGNKYHRASCRTLRNGGIPSTLGEASKRYGPCAVCRPPVLSAPAAPPPPASVGPAAAGASRPAATSGRCQATTKKGTQCSRRAQVGRNYCWQH